MALENEKGIERKLEVEWKIATGAKHTDYARPYRTDCERKFEYDGTCCV